MYSISFENTLGTVQLCGGSQPLMEPLSVSGLGLPESRYETATFLNVPGQILVAKQDKPRYITLKGHGYGVKVKMQEACRILSRAGVLTFQNEMQEKCIEARCTAFSDLERTARGAYAVTVTFCCDFPYFKNPKNILVPIYSRLKRLSTPFTLPCMLSERVTSGNCKNDGQVASEPVLTVKNHGITTVNGFSLVNNQSGATLQYLGALQPGESVILHVENRTVQGANGEEQLHNLAENSYLSAFVLLPGDNVLTMHSVGDLRCQCQYNVHYAECLL